MIVRFFSESSQIRNRAYIVEPMNRADRIVSVGRLLVIGAVGAMIAVVAEFVVPVPLALRAVTLTRIRKPRSPARSR